MEKKIIAAQNDRADIDRTYTVQEVAFILKIKPRTAYALCSSNPPFKVIRIGRSVRVKKASFDQWFEECGSD